MKRVVFFSTLVMSFLCICSFLQAQNETIEFDASIVDMARKIHDQSIIIDAHAHNFKLKATGKENQLCYNVVKKGGIDVIGLYFAYYPIKNNALFQKVKHDMKNIHDQVEDSQIQVSFINNSQQIIQSAKNNKLALLPGVEYFFGTFSHDVSIIDSLYNIGIRSFTLMDNEYDRLSNNKVLNDFGKQIIDRMNDLGMLIDITHLNDSMQMQVIEYSEAPVIASHSPVRAVNNVQRNIPDRILKALSAKDGAIMITFNSGALAGLEEGRTGIQSLIKHIDHAVEIAGIDHVGIGSDYNGAGTRSPSGLEDASGFPNITLYLLKNGYSQKEIQKIMGVNFIKVMQSMEDASKF